MLHNTFCRRLAALVLTLAVAVSAVLPVFAVYPMPIQTATETEAVYLFNADTGKTLLTQNADQPRYVASLTKLMTALLLLESGKDLNGEVTVPTDLTQEFKDIQNANGTTMGLRIGETVRRIDLLNALLITSANDAANVLAEYTAGSMEAFVELMNAKAAELGLAGTHFVNANGLHSADHYTTPYDMARLTQWAMTVPGFSELFGATSYTMQPTNKQEQERLFGTDNCMLVTNKYQYEGTTGGKSGWTEEAGYTMVETVTRSGRSLICVVMGSAKKYDKFSDSIALLDYCFDYFTPVTLAASDITSPQVPVYYAEGAPSVGSAPLALSEDIPAPQCAGCGRRAGHV